MRVYVDDMEAPYGRLKMCHMIADSTEELLAMADRIGVRRKWIQKAGTPSEHFDIAKSKRALAVAAGAIEVTMHQLVVLIDKRRPVPKLPAEMHERYAVECPALAVGDGDGR